MGTDISNNGIGRKSSDGSKHPVYNYANWRSFIVDKRPHSKMETKFIVLRLLDLLGIGWGSKLIFTHIDNVKDVVLFFILVLYAITRYIFYVIKQRQLIRKENFEQRQRELNANHK